MQDDEDFYLGFLNLSFWGWSQCLACAKHLATVYASMDVSFVLAFKNFNSSTWKFLNWHGFLCMTLTSHTSQGCIFIDGEVKGLGDHNFVLSLHNPTPPTARAPCKCPQRCPARKNWVALLPSHYHLTFPFLILLSKFLTQNLKVFIGPSHFKHRRLNSELIKNKYSLPFDLSIIWVKLFFLQNFH